MRKDYYPNMSILSPTQKIDNIYYMRQVRRRILESPDKSFPDYFLQKLIKCDKCSHYFSFNMYPQNPEYYPYYFIYRDFEKNRYKKNICHYCNSDKWLTNEAKARLSSNGIRANMLNNEIIEIQKRYTLTRYLIKNSFKNQPYMKFKIETK